MSLAKLLGEEFLSSEHCIRAFTHRSVSSKNNERLEFLGDSLLGFFIAAWLFEHFPSYPEGDLTRIRAYLVKKDTLAKIAREHDLGKHLVLGAGELKTGGIRRSSILADALEALIGAVYTSQGFEEACNFVEKLYATRLDSIPTIEQLKDAKTRLQELLQSNGQVLPIYKIVEKHGKSGNETFSVQCVIENCPETFIGVGASRRKAEQEVAELAYEFITKQINS
ncbi:MAG: ribonuclease III [Gammaproteobacteria bacterium]